MCLGLSETDAGANAQRLHDEHGYCVGMSSGTNTVTATRLRDRGLKVATVWPDCSDRYVSMGLDAPRDGDGSCPLSSRCSARWKEVIER